MASFVERVRGTITVRWEGLRRRIPALDHFVRAYRHYKDNHGDHLAASITYFSFLALFPLVFVAVSVTGFVLDSHPALLGDIYNAIDRNVPGGFGQTLKDTVDYAIRHKQGVGLIGLVGFAWSGLGWIANLRTAIDVVWGAPKVERNFVVGKLLDALVLFGLGVGVVLSIGLTAVGTTLSGRFVEWVHLGDQTVALFLVKLVGILIAVLGDLLVFGWLLIRLPRAVPPPRVALRTALLAAVGFEILKFVGTFLMARLSQSPAAAALGAIVAVLIFMDLVSRYLLYCAAWAATAEGSQQAPIPDRTTLSEGRGADSPKSDPDRAEDRDEAGRPPISPAGIAAGLLSAGAAAGAAAAVGSRRWRRRARQRRAASPH